jgi:predicted DNA-binding protein (UPF0251 family)
MRITPEAFAQLCKLARLRPASQSTAAARLVLVDGMRPADAARALGIPAQLVNDAATQARKAAARAVAVAAGVAL